MLTDIAFKIARRRVLRRQSHGDDITRRTG